MVEVRKESSREGAPAAAADDGPLRDELCPCELVDVSREPRVQTMGVRLGEARQLAFGPRQQVAAW